MTQTKTPWKASFGKVFATEDGIFTLVADTTRHEDAEPKFYVNTEDAAFIVKAANSHDALVEALEDAAAYMALEEKTHNRSESPAHTRIRAALIATKGE